MYNNKGPITFESMVLDRQKKNRNLVKPPTKSVITILLPDCLCMYATQCMQPGPNLTIPLRETVQPVSL